MQTQLANFNFGRILLHLACACRDHKYQWHWRGILREFSRPDNLHLLGRISFMLMFSLVSLARSATPPTIPGSPTNVTVAVGSALNLAVTASGEALQYQWRKDGLDVPNATSATLTVAGSKLDDAGVYSVRVSNGSGSTNSDPAAVSVLNNVAWSDNFSVDPTLSGWQTSQWQNVGGFSWQAARRLFTISNSAPNDSALYRTVTGLLPNHNY